ncbi:MAG: SurA N-terminal domain-containing protein [Clostridia bacterium]|nr:SurA N-terminal domain-containing protein [Clostridia bacterium]MBQ7865025.1 SurA N-terminal domain-containing protein [Clostridia bacterium]
MRKKSLLALLLAVAVLLTGCALVEKDPEVDRATEIIRVGDTVYTKGQVQDEVAYQLSYMNYIYSMYGMAFDANDPETIAQAQQQVIDYLIEEAVLTQKIDELGLSTLTEEEQAALDAQVEAAWTQNLDSVKASYFADTELAGEELDAALTAKCEELGVTRESLVKAETAYLLQDKLYNHIVKDVTVTDEELLAAYTENVEADRATFETTPSAYGARINNASTTAYYRPAGYRMVKQILVEFTPDDLALLNEVEGLIAEQKAAVTAAETALTNLGVADADTLLTKVTVSMAQPAMAVSFLATATNLTNPVATQAPAMDVTAAFDDTVDEATAAAVKSLAEAKALLAFYQHQLTTATNNAFANLDAEADAIIAQLKEGADWDVLMAEKTDDPGMKEGAATAITGYAVCEGFASFDEPFVTAAMALKNVGDISPKTRGAYGYYIIQYAADVAEGAIPMEEVQEELTAAQLTTKQEATYDQAIAQWVTESNATVNYEALK